MTPNQAAARTRAASPWAWVKRNPALTAGLLSLPCFAALAATELPPESPHFRLLIGAWRVLGAGPHAAANLLARVAPALPGWLDVLLVVLLGAIPYLLADFALRRLLARKPRIPTR